MEAKKYIRFIPVLLLILMITGCKNGSGTAKQVNAAEAGELIGKGNIRILDVRTPAEFSAGHIPGAENLDLFSASFEQDIKKLDPSAHYLVYCLHGNRSVEAVSVMETAGLKNITNLSGGIATWKGPVTR